MPSVQAIFKACRGQPSLHLDSLHGPGRALRDAHCTLVTRRGRQGAPCESSPVKASRAATLRVAPVFLAVVLSLLLTGCTPGDAGSTGISVDAQGHPVVVFALCSGHIDAAMIYRGRTPADPSGVDDTVDVADWEARQEITPETGPQRSLRTAMPSEYWRRTERGELILPGVHYTAFGGTRDNTYYTPVTSSSRSNGSRM